MPVSTILQPVEHGCCQPRRFRRRQCICNCHDVRITDWTRKAPSTSAFDRWQLVWSVDQNYGRAIGVVQERLPESKPLGSAVYPCCAHCHDHAGPWLGSDSLTEGGHTEPCQNCQHVLPPVQGAGGYGIYGDGVGLMAVVDDPWTAVGILSAWSQTGRASA